MSLMRTSTKPKGGSQEELDGMLKDGFRSLASSLGTNISEERERTDEFGNPILGGELLVKIVDAEVISASNVSSQTYLI